MSNCIEIVKDSGGVLFTYEEVDIPALTRLLTEAKEPSPGKTDWTDPEKREYHAWWFLQRNCDIGTHAIKIWFGQGRSSHTGRDFAGTIWALSHFMRKPKWHRFFVTDEFDGHKQVFKMNVEFKSLHGVS